MTSPLRPYLAPLLFAAIAATVLIVTARWNFGAEPAGLSADGDPIERAKSDLLRQIRDLKEGTSEEHGRFDADGRLIEWTDMFRPPLPGDEFRKLSAGLHVLKTPSAAIPTLIDSTAVGVVWHQSRPLALLDGPIRLHASPIEDVALMFGDAAPDGEGMRIDSVVWGGSTVAYVLADSSASAIGAPRNALFSNGIWSMAAVICVLIFLVWIRRIAPERISTWVTIAVCASLPEWIATWAEAESWAIWIRAIPYAVASFLLGQMLLRTKRLYGFTWYPRTIGISLVYGSLSGFILIALTRSTYRLSAAGSMQTLGIDILPHHSILSMYFGTAILTASVLAAILLTGWFLMNTEADQLRWMHGSAFLGFAYSLTVGVSMTADPDLRLLMLSAISGFVLYGISFAMHKRAESFRALSPFRQLFLASFLVASFMWPMYQWATQRQYERGLHELAERTARHGIGPVHAFGLQSPYRISLYEDGERIEKAGDYANGQFNDRTRLFEGYRSLTDGDKAVRMVDGPFFRYQEIAARKGDIVAVVSARVQNAYNHMFSYVRLLFLLLGSSLILIPLGRLAAGRSVALFRGRERFEHRILDTYILTSFLFLVALVILSRQIIVNQSSARVELDLINTLEILADRIEALPDAETDYFVYVDGRLSDFGEQYPFEGHLPTPVIPQSVQETLYQVGQDRAVFRKDSPIGPLTVVFKSLDERTVLAIPANLNANKYMDEILQSTNFTIIVYLVIFGLFIGGTVLISREMMHPIHEFRSGLQRIAAGQLDTLIPVTSKDEIGELANAYNLMVFKLKDLQDELADKERQTAWAEMARQVAHEIKNPLTPMKLSVQHLYQQIQFGEKTMEEVKPMIAKISDTLIREIDSLNNIANDFSKFARPITEDFTWVDLNHCVESILNLYQHDRRLYLWTDLSEEPLRVFAAQDELKRVLLNLVKNAMEALPQGGIVVIRTYRFGDHAYAEVIDNGSGIAEDLKSRIFVPNFSTKNTGTGLGLAICKKVIEAHKGRIEFASAAGLGTTFTLRIPLSVDA